MKWHTDKPVLQNDCMALLAALRAPGREQRGLLEGVRCATPQGEALRHAMAETLDDRRAGRQRVRLAHAPLQAAVAKLETIIRSVPAAPPEPPPEEPPFVPVDMVRPATANATAVTAAADALAAAAPAVATIHEKIDETAALVTSLRADQAALVAVVTEARNTIERANVLAIKASLEAARAAAGDGLRLLASNMDAAACTMETAAAALDAAFRQHREHLGDTDAALAAAQAAAAAARRHAVASSEALAAAAPWAAAAAEAARQGNDTQRALHEAVLRQTAVLRAARTRSHDVQRLLRETGDGIGVLKIAMDDAVSALADGGDA